MPCLASSVENSVNVIADEVPVAGITWLALVLVAGAGVAVLYMTRV